MKQYWVEGVYTKTGKPSKKRGSRLEPEPFARSYLAASPAEAIRMATEDLGGGVWVDGPHVSDKTEEQRMRQQGQPELPGFGAPARPKKKR